MSEQDNPNIPVPPDSDLGKILIRLQQMRTERNWAQFHTPRTFVESMVIEASEALGVFRWMVVERDLTTEERDHLGQELGDTLINLLQVAELAKVDLIYATNRKIDINAENYPVDKSLGKPDKYTKYK